MHLTGFESQLLLLLAVPSAVPSRYTWRACVFVCARRVVVCPPPWAVLRPPARRAQGLACSCSRHEPAIPALWFENDRTSPSRAEEPEEHCMWGT